MCISQIEMNKVPYADPGGGGGGGGGVPRCPGTPPPRSSQ